MKKAAKKKSIPRRRVIDHPDKGQRVMGAPYAPLPALVIPSAQDLERIAQTSVTNLHDVRLLAERQMAIEDEIADTEERLGVLNAKLRQIATVDLPTAMDAAGITGCDLYDGISVAVAEFINGSIKEENRERVYAWLRSNKFGSLIKNEIKVQLGRGEDKQAKQIVAFLKKLKIRTFGRKEGVHPSTLQAFVREQLKAGKGLPPEIEVIKVPTAKIIRPKREE